MNDELLTLVSTTSCQFGRHEGSKAKHLHFSNVWLRVRLFWLTVCLVGLAVRLVGLTPGLGYGAPVLAYGTPFLT